MDDTGEVPELWEAISVMLPTAASAASFLMFNLLDAPGLAAISTMFKEMNSRKWSWFALGWQMFYAYTVALIVYQLFTWFATGVFGFWTVVALIVLLWYVWMIFVPCNKRSGSAKAGTIRGNEA